jgi:aminopeptidase-like protein
MASHLLRASGRQHAVVPFEPWGYDERQYCSPGFDLPVGSLMRTPHGRFPEYHTSADDLGFVRAEALADSLALVEEIVAGLEANRTYRSRNPHGEPQLGRRGLWDAVGGRGRSAADLAMLWVLNLADGRHALLDVAERSGLALATVAAAAAKLVAHALLDEVVA